MRTNAILRGRRVRRGLGDDDTMDCLAQANAAVQPLDDRISWLVKNWKPSGYYSPSQMQAVLEQLGDQISRAYAELEKPTHQSHQAITDGKNQLVNMQNELGVYNAKVVEARRSNIEQIDAPGLRGITIRALSRVRDAITAASFVGCMEPWWVGAMKSFQHYFDIAWNAIKSIPGIIFDAAKTVLTIPDVISTLMKYSLLAGAAVLAYYLWKPSHARGASEH